MGLITIENIGIKGGENVVDKIVCILQLFIDELVDDVLRLVTRPLRVVDGIPCGLLARGRGS